MSATSPPPSRVSAGPVLFCLVFFGGLTTMGVEMSGARLVAPYFGTSLYVWAVLIGLIMVYLTAGYYLGGRVADRYPRSEILYRLTLVAGLWIGIIPSLSHPVLLWSVVGFDQLSAGIFLGSLAGVVLLFAVPVVILGCVAPFAVRLAIGDVGAAGNVAGTMYALSSVGSLVGTFLPVFVLIPTVGTRRTLLVLSAALMLASLAGLWRRSLLYGLVLLPTAIQLILPGGPVRAADGGRIIDETESAYYYIQVVQNGSARELVLDEGHAVHSVYDPRRLFTGEYWDYFLTAPFFRQRYSPESVRRVAVLGLGGGTAVRLFHAAYPRAALTGVEIDPAIVDIARRYFNLHEPHLSVVTEDARYFLLTHSATYDVIAVDAFHQPYIPFQLTTRDFFALARSRMTTHGVLAMNAGHTPTDYRLVGALARTMRSVFPSVSIIDVPGTINSMIIASNDRVSHRNLQRSAAAARGVSLHAAALLMHGDIRAPSASGSIFTDDLAPVEQLIDQIVVDYVRSGS